MRHLNFTIHSAVIIALSLNILIATTSAVAEYDVRFEDKTESGATSTYHNMFALPLLVGNEVIINSYANDMHTRPNHDHDFVIRNLLTGAISRPNIAYKGNFFIHDSSDDGRYLAIMYCGFLTANPPQPPNLDPLECQVAIYDRQTSTYEFVKNVGSYGGDASMTADGSKVVFWKDQEVFLYTRGSNNPIQITPVGDPSLQGESPFVGSTSKTRISKDGRFVVFSSRAIDLESGDSNRSHDVFLYNVGTSITTRINEGPGGAQDDSCIGATFWGHEYCGLYNSNDIAISPDGSMVAFSSAGRTLVTGDTNTSETDNTWDGEDLFLYKTATGELTRISVGPNGEEVPKGIGGSTRTGLMADPWFSPDNKYIAFFSSKDLTDNMSGAKGTGLYVKNLQTGAMTRILGPGSHSSGVYGEMLNTRWSADNRVYFRTASTDIISPVPSGGHYHLYSAGFNPSTTPVPTPTVTPTPDPLVPTVEARDAEAVAGRIVRLRFVVDDDSGKISGGSIKVLIGEKTRKIAVPAGKASGKVRNVPFQTKRRQIGEHEWCVTVRDKGGRKSAESCANLTLTARK